MVIVHVGSPSLQVRRGRSERQFKERLVAEIEQWVRHLVARCIEEVLEAEVTEVLGREWYERRRDQERCWVDAYCGKSFTVRKRIRRFFDERTRRMVKLRDVVILEGVFCEVSPLGFEEYAGCDRTCFLFWKESWLERV